MLHSKTFKDYLQEYALIVVGSVIYAAGFRFFYYPNDIIAGGVTGIAIILEKATQGKTSRCSSWPGAPSD